MTSLQIVIHQQKKRIWAHTKCTISHGINHHSIMVFYFNPLYVHTEWERFCMIYVCSYCGQSSGLHHASLPNTIVVGCFFEENVSERKILWVNHFFMTTMNFSLSIKHKLKVYLLIRVPITNNIPIGWAKNRRTGKIFSFVCHFCESASQYLYRLDVAAA